MSAYDKIDLLIVEAVKGGSSKFDAINAGAVKDEAMRLHHEDWKVRGCSAKSVFRIIDSRLQALRKSGLIVHRKGQGWVVSQKEAA